MKQPFAEAHPRLSFVALLTVEVVVSDLYAAIKLTAEPVMALLRGIMRFHTVLRDIANLSRDFCKFCRPHACRPVPLSPLPASDLSRCLSLSICGLFSYASPSSSASQYALVYKGFSLHQDDLLYWQLPAQFTGDKVTKKKKTRVASWSVLRDHRNYGTFRTFRILKPPHPQLLPSPSPHISPLLPIPFQGCSTPSCPLDFPHSSPRSKRGLQHFHMT